MQVLGDAYAGIVFIAFIILFCITLGSIINKRPKPNAELIIQARAKIRKEQERKRAERGDWFKKGQERKKAIALERKKREEWERTAALARSTSQMKRATESHLTPKPIPGVSTAIAGIDSELDTKSEVKVLRGGEFVGNRMRFKVKVSNDSPFSITDVTVYILAYPHDALQYSGEDHHIFFSKIEPGGFRSPTFDFLPTQDCVKGEIVAGISFMDIKNKPHTLTAKPFVIRSVCDLLLPQRVTPQDFALKLKERECGEIVVKIEEWTPEEMFDKALTIVDESNFFEVSSKSEETEGIVYAEIIGFAQGKYTGKEVGVEIRISGPTKKKGASCTIRVSGEDQAMILPAIDDLKERLSAWLCPMCSSPLTLESVAALREGKVIECPFCSVSIGR